MLSSAFQTRLVRISSTLSDFASITLSCHLSDRPLMFASYHAQSVVLRYTGWPVVMGNILFVTTSIVHTSNNSRCQSPLQKILCLIYCTIAANKVPSTVFVRGSGIHIGFNLKDAQRTAADASTQDKSSLTDCEDENDVNLTAFVVTKLKTCGTFWLKRQHEGGSFERMVFIPLPGFMQSVLVAVQHLSKTIILGQS